MKRSFSHHSLPKSVHKFDQGCISVKRAGACGAAGIPSLQHGLERVLFNPGIHVLHDSRSGIYNFDPFLKKVHQPDQFNFSNISKFIPSSEDSHLISLAKTKGATYFSSTSSMSPALSQLYFLLTKLKAPNLNQFVSQAFLEEPQSFTSMTKGPISLLLKNHGGCYSIVTEKLGDEPTILSQLGQSLEKVLTCSKDEFALMLKNSRSSDIKDKRDAYVYSEAGKFLLRSQIDCINGNLPRKTFDLKTRATLPIRMDVANYKA